MAEAAFNCLALSSFAMAFSLPAGRIMLVVAFVMFCIDCHKAGRLPHLTGVTWLAIGFMAIAVIATMQGVDPAGTWHKLRKLPWYFAIVLYASLVTTAWRLNIVLSAFAAGTGVLAVCNLISNPIKAFKTEGGTFVQALTDTGSMTDAQRLMAGMLVVLALIVTCRKVGRRCLPWLVVLLLQGAALLISFKRGSWMCLVVVIGIVLAMKANWRYVVGLIAAVFLLALLPPVRSRLADLGSEFDVEKGGRLTMWFKVAPVLSSQHPWFGIGWRAMTSEIMTDIAPGVEPNRNHLHSNIAEIIVETGWLGFVVYLAWMVKALWDTASFHRGVRNKSAEEEFNSLALLAVLGALLLNGLVEFNFADGELVLIYSMVIGCAVAGLERLEFRPMGIRLQVH